MDTPQQYPTMWTTGYLKNGMKVSFTFPIRNEMEACKQALEITNKLIADCFMIHEPGLEAGEESEMIGRVSRRAKKNNDGTISPIIDLFGVHDALKFKIVSMYLDTPEDIAAFESACGVKLASLPLNPTKAAVERDDENFVVVLPQPAKAILKANPDYREDIDDKKPKRKFVRWEFATPAPATPPPAAGNPTPTSEPEPQPEPPRNARLQNEELVITRMIKTGVVSGNKDPKKNGFKYDGWGKIDDNGQKFDVRVWIFPEDLPLITAAGYEFHEGGENYIPIVMDTTDRAMTRIASVTPKAQPATERAWDAEAWDAIVDYCALNGVLPKDVLNVERGSQWKRGFNAAIKAIDTYVANHPVNVDFMAQKEQKTA